MPRFLQPTFYSMLAMACLLLAACSSEPKTPEDEIRQFIDRAITAAEDRNSGDLMEMIAENYSDQKKYDKGRLSSVVRALFFRHKNIFLFKRISDIHISGTNSATVEVFVAMTGQRLSDITQLASFRARIYRFNLELIKDSEWQVLTASWAPAKATDLQ
jgi:hypothetical protein